MKNALLIVLVVLVAVLAFLLFKPESMASESRAKHHRKDHNKKAVETEDCARTGQDNKTCVILISYLQSMTHGGPDTAIEVRRKDTIKWVGDSGETIEVLPMKGVLCSDHTKDDKADGGDESLIGPVTGTGNIQIAQVTGNPKNDLYCYKTNIKVTQNGQTTIIDPHLFDGGP